MMQHESIQSKSLYWLISPYGLAAASLAPLFLTLLISRDSYETYANEPCLMCGDVWMPFFCILNTAMFVLGAKISNIFVVGRHLSRAKSPAFTAASMQMLVLIMIGLTLLNIISFGIMVKNTPGLIGLILSGGGDVAKSAINTEGAFSQVQPLLIYFNAYALLKYLTIKDELSVAWQRTFRLLFLIAVVVTVLIAIAKVARYEMMPVLISLALVYALHLAKTKRITNGVLLSYLLIGFVGLVGVFSLFSVMRGFVEVEDVIGTLIGYGPASYNHLVALLSGEMVMTHGGTGVYAFPFLGHVPLLESMFKITDKLGLPSAEMAFLAEFIDTEYAGLNRGYIWVTFYGYVFSDLGYWVFLFMFALGVAAASLFRDFVGGGGFGGLLYPLIFVGMVLAFSFNITLRPSSFAVLIVAVFIAWGERLMRAMFGVDRIQFVRRPDVSR